MTDIYGRLCTYLDLAAINPSSPLPRPIGLPEEETIGVTSAASGEGEETASSGDQPSAGGVPATGTVTIGAGSVSDFVPPPPLPPAADTSAPLGAAATAAAAVPPDPVVALGTTNPAAVRGSGGDALSTFIAAPRSSSSSSSPAASPTAGAGAGSGSGVAAAAASGRVGEGCCTAEELKALEEGVMDDLDVSDPVTLNIYGRQFTLSPRAATCGTL